MNEEPNDPARARSNEPRPSRNKHDDTDDERGVYRGATHRRHFALSSSGPASPQLAPATDEYN